MAEKTKNKEDQGNGMKADVNKTEPVQMTENIQAVPNTEQVYKKEVNSIKEGMRRLVHDVQKERLTQLSEQVNQNTSELEQIRQDIDDVREIKRGMGLTAKDMDKGVRKEISSLLDEVMKNKENISRMLQEKGDSANTRSDMQTLFTEVVKNREGINKVIGMKKALEETFKNKMKEAEGFKDDMKKLDSKKAFSAIDMLNSRLKMLESGIGSFQEILARLERMEAEITAMKGYVPAVIE